jgi:NADPH-dependent glutamate synthase beta subunit-like oxidoreductase
MPDRPIRVAVVGAGPAGLYAAAHLLEHEAGTYLSGRLSRTAPERAVEVDVFDRLPTPWGLVRSGVAPDHPHKKLISRVFDAVAARPGFRFFGNVDIGVHVSIDELRHWYDAVLVAVGAAGDRALGIPGEQLAGSFSARELVGWYNGNPDLRELDVTLPGEHAVVVGNGNVALDVTRMLLSTPEQLGHTDIAEHALQTLGSSPVRHVSVLGRRGPAESAFNYAEFEELMRLPGVDLIVEDATLALDQAFDARGRSWRCRNKLRLLEAVHGRPRADWPKSIRLHYFTTPVEVLGSDSVTGLAVHRHRPGVDTPSTLTAQQHSVLPCSTVVRAIGYEGRPVPGLPFDDVRFIIPNDHGRVVDAAGPVAGVYVTGWIKRGPQGVIGTNKKCARDTVQLIFGDLAAARLPMADTVDASRVPELLAQRRRQAVDYAGWRRINHRECQRGLGAGRPRIKFTSRADLLAAASPNPVNGSAWTGNDDA